MTHTVRQTELLRLLCLGRDAASDGRRVAVVMGEPGIGKTRLARAAAAELAQEGFTVAWGRADVLERVLPYSALDQAFAALTGGSATWRSTSSVDLTEVLEPAVRLLTERAVAGPLVVAVDDLQFADDDTLTLLGLLVRRLGDVPALWLFTCRSQLATASPLLRHLLDRLKEDVDLEEIVLGPLGGGDIAALVREVAGIDNETLATDITRRSAGNPFFAVQIALSLHRWEPGKPVPAVSKPGALLERIFPAGEVAREVARLGTVFSHVDLRRLTSFALILERPLADVQEAFDLLMRAGLLVEGVGTRYEFTHDIVREWLYADLGPTERHRLHGLVARDLLAQREDVDIDPLELAHHLSQSRVGRDEDAARALRDAGDATLVHAPRSAASWYSEAIEHLPSGSAKYADLHLRLARALSRSGQPHEVERVSRQGLKTATGVTRDRLSRFLATALADIGRYHEAMAMIDDEIAERGPSFARRRTRALLHQLLDEIDVATAELAALADLATSPTERATALGLRLAVAADFNSPAGTVQLLGDIDELLPTLTAAQQMSVLAHTASAAMASNGPAAGAARLRAVADLEARGVPNPDWHFTVATQVGLDIEEGRWDDAVRLYEQRREEYQTDLRLLVRNFAAVRVAVIHALRKDVDQVRRIAGDVWAVSAEGRRAKAFLDAHVRILEGDRLGAIGVLEDALQRAPSATMMTNFILFTRCDLDRMLGHRDEAVVWLERFEKAIAGGENIIWRVAAAFERARLAPDLEQMLAGLELTIAHGIPYAEAALRTELARAGVDADANLAAAHATFSRLGAVDDLADVQELFARGGGSMTRSPEERRWTLTPAEQRVAALVARGMTNKAIAEELSYSVKTIEAYLSRAYYKTGCANRVELAVTLTSAGEVGPA